ncbi:hypothetical protein C8R43DRAFT_1114941 [Mycena crocata]|nr:hypothetical protein C8R43DRAFT_1114941 [Mycena crocata]
MLTHVNGVSTLCIFYQALCRSTANTSGTDARRSSFRSRHRASLRFPAARPTDKLCSPTMPRGFRFNEMHRVSASKAGNFVRRHLFFSSRICFFVILPRCVAGNRVTGDAVSRRSFSSTTFTKIVV